MMIENEDELEMLVCWQCKVGRVETLDHMDLFVT